MVQPFALERIPVEVLEHYLLSARLDAQFLAPLQLQSSTVSPSYSAAVVLMVGPFLKELPVPVAKVEMLRCQKPRGREGL